MRLLIVEDEKQMCDTVARSLYAAGYEVDTCYDGAEALECILAENYDLIVLDLNLPGMDGMDLLKELRKENEETKVLILSARGQIADKVEGLDAGANDYMEKPFHLQEAGGDLIKLAVMPRDATDVLALLSVTTLMHKEAKVPLITMSMGALGAISRLSGEVFGSAVTFASAAGSSAPGQLSIDLVAQTLSLLHEALAQEKREKSL